MTSEQIRIKLETLSKDKNLRKAEALIIMIIGHGSDEKIYGSNSIINPNDMIKISEIVDIFSEKNCESLSQTPKIFFFNCCRESKS